MSKKTVQKRQYPRAKISLRVDYGSPLDVQTTDYMHNLGHGGIFIRTENPMEVGVGVDLEFTLPETFRTIKAKAKVVWTRPESERDLFPMGMGLTFTEIKPEDHETLILFVKKLLREAEKS